MLGALLCAVALVASACSSSDDRATATSTTYVSATGGTINVGLDQAPTGCNPNVADGHTWANLLALAPVLPSAFVVTPTGASQINTPFLDQAELVNTQPQTVVYTINPKAVWGDGVPITAADFVFAWQHQRGTIIDPAHPWGDEATTLGYSDITSVTGSSKGRTVTVVFQSPFADWQMLFADLLPAHVLAKVGWDPPCTTVNPAIDLSGGPFAVRAASSGRILLVPNPRWWGQAPNLDRVVLRFAASDAELARWLQNGTVQVAQPTAFSQPFLETAAGLRTSSSELDISANFLELEMSTTSPVTSDVSVRTAVADAIDRTSLAETTVGWADLKIVPSESHVYVQNQSGYPGPTPAPLNSTTSTTTTTTAPGAAPGTTPFPLTAQPAETRRLLTAAGYAQDAAGTWRSAIGSPLQLRLVIDQGDSWAVATGLRLVPQLQHAGFAVAATAAPDAATAGADLASGAADLALLPLTTTPFASATGAWYTPLLGPPGKGGSQNWMNLDDTDVNNLYGQAAAELNPVNAQSVYNQTDQRLWALMAGLPLFAEPTLLVWGNLTDGVQAYPYSPGLLVDSPSWSVRVPVPADRPNTSVTVGPGTT